MSAVPSEAEGKVEGGQPPDDRLEFVYHWLARNSLNDDPALSSHLRIIGERCAGDGAGGTVEGILDVFFPAHAAGQPFPSKVVWHGSTFELMTETVDSAMLRRIEGYGAAFGLDVSCTFRLYFGWKLSEAASQERGMPSTDPEVVRLVRHYFAERCWLLRVLAQALKLIVDAEGGTYESDTRVEDAQYCMQALGAQTPTANDAASVLVKLALTQYRSDRVVANTLSERGDGALRELIARERCAERFELLELLGTCVQVSPKQSKQLRGIGKAEMQKPDTEYLGLVHERDIRLAESVLRLSESSARMSPHNPDFNGIEQICNDMTLAASLQYATVRNAVCMSASVVWRELFACALERLAKSCMAAQAAGEDAPPEQAFLLDPDRAVAFLTVAFEGNDRLCNAFWGHSSISGFDFPALRRIVTYAARQEGQNALLRLVLGGPASARALLCALRDDTQLEAAACKDSLGSLRLCAALARHGQPCAGSDVPFRLLSSTLPSLLRCTPSTRPHQPLLALLLHCTTHLQSASPMDATMTSECDTGNIVGETCELDIAADCLDVLTTLAQTEHASASTRARRIVLERVLTAVPTDEMVTEVDLQSQIAGSVLGSIEVLRRRELELRGRCKFALAMLRFFRSLLVQTQWFALCPDVQAVFDHVDAHGSGNIHRSDFCRSMAELGCTLPPHLVDILFDDSSSLPVTTCVEFVQKWGSVVHSPFGAEKRPQQSAQQSATALCQAIHATRRRLCERSLVRQQHLERVAVRSAIDMFVLWQQFEALDDRVELLKMATELLSDVIDFPDNDAQLSSSMSAHSLVLHQFLHDYSLLRALCAAIMLPKHVGKTSGNSAVTETVALNALQLFETLMLTHGTGWKADLKAAMATRELVLIEGKNSISLIRAVANNLSFTSTMPATEISLQRAVVSTRILTALTSVMRGISQLAGCDMMSHLGGEEALEDLRLGLLHWAGIEAPKSFSLVDELKASVWEFAYTALEAQPTLSSIFLGVPESVNSDETLGDGCASALDQLFQTLASPVASNDNESDADLNSSSVVRHAAFRLLRELWDGAVNRMQPHCAAVGYLREKVGFWHVLCQPLKEQHSSFVPGQGNRATLKNIADYCCELSCRSHCLHIIVLERHYGMHSMFRCLGPDDVGVVLESVSDQMSLGPTPNPNTPTASLSRPGVRVRGPRGNVSWFRTNELAHVKSTTESKDKDKVSAIDRRRRKEAQSPYRTLSASADWVHMNKEQKADKLRLAVDESLSMDTESAHKMSPETPAVRVCVGQSVKLLKQRCCTALVAEELKHEIEGEEPDWYIDNWARRFAHFFFAEHNERKEFWQNFSELGIDITRFRTHVERQRYGPDFEFGIRRLRVLLPGGNIALAGMPERALKANVLASLEHGQLTLLRSWRVYMEVVHLQHGDQTLKRGNLAMSPHLSPKPHSPKPKHLFSVRAPPLSARPSLVGLNGFRSMSLETLNVLGAALREHIQHSGRDEAHETWYWLSVMNTIKEKCEIFLAVLHHQLHEVKQQALQHEGELQPADCWHFLALLNLLHQHVRERVLCQSASCDDTNVALPIFEALLTASLLLLQRVDVLRRCNDPLERQPRVLVTKTYELEDHQTLLDEVVGQACFCMRLRKVLHPDYGVELSPQIQRSEIDLDAVSPQARLLRRLFCIGAACVTTCVSMSAPHCTTQQHTFERRQRACVDMITTNRVLPLLLTALDAAGTSISLAYKFCRQQESDRADQQPQPAGDGKHASLCEQIVADGAARMEAVLLLLLRIASFAGGATAILEMGVLPTICRNPVFRAMMDIAPQARGFHSVQPHADSVQSCSVWWGYSSCNERCDVHQKCWCLVPELARTLIRSLHTQRVRWGLSIECESAMDSQLNVLVSNFAPLLYSALQLRTFTMAGLDETEAIVALLSSLCMWWHHKLAVVTHGKCGALFDASMRLTRDIIVLLRYPRDDGWLNPVADEPRRRTEELRSRNTRHHMKMSAHVQAVSVLEKNEEKRTRDQRRYRRIRSWMLWYAKENRGKAADDGSKVSKADKKKKRGAARRSRALQATLQREDHDTRHALALDFHSAIERRMCSVLHYTLQAVRKLTPRLPRDGNVDVQAAEPLLPLHETQCFTRQYSDGLGGTLPLSVGHCVLCVEHCLQEICGGDLSKWPRKDRDKKREIDVLEQWIFHQQALRSMLFNAVHIITSNLRLHDMLYDFFRSQSLEQFHCDLKNLQARAEQLDMRNMYPPPMLPLAAVACNDVNTAGTTGNDIYDRLQNFRPTQLRSTRIFRRVLMAQCDRHGVEEISGASPCVETRLEPVVLSAIRSWHVTLRLEERPSKRQQPGGQMQQLALEQQPQPMTTSF